ncbi:MAG: class I SAM-dependent methyltransferase, partial [Pseudolysinimonas sp.]
RRVIAYPIWMWHWSDPSDPALPWPQFRTLDVDPAVKARAIAAFSSQIDGQDPTLRPEMLEHFLAEREVYIELGPESNDPPELGADYFEELHRRRDDPWRFLTRWYEERKRAIVLSGLLERRYGSALEVGCSIGVLTSGLADRCDELLAVDISAAAVHSAQQRVGARARVEQVDVSEQFPSGPFDLIVLSEVGYYFSAARLDAVLVAARGALNPNGELVACHWRHPVENYPLLGDEVHRRIGMLGLPRLVRHEEDDFLFEVFSNDDRSVGRREGLA